MSFVVKLFGYCSIILGLHPVQASPDIDPKNSVFILSKKWFQLTGDTTSGTFRSYAAVVNEKNRLLRITSDENRPVTGISMDGEDVLLNGKRCMEEGIDYEPLPDQPSTLKQYLREKELKTKERERAVGD